MLTTFIHLSLSKVSWLPSWAIIEKAPYFAMKKSAQEVFPYYGVYHGYLSENNKKNEKTTVHTRTTVA